MSKTHCSAQNLGLGAQTRPLGRYVRRHLQLCGCGSARIQAEGILSCVRKRQCLVIFPSKWGCPVSRPLAYFHFPKDHVLQNGTIVREECGGTLIPIFRISWKGTFACLSGCAGLSAASFFSPSLKPTLRDTPVPVSFWNFALPYPSLGLMPLLKPALTRCLAFSCLLDALVLQLAEASRDFQPRL